MVKRACNNNMEDVVFVGARRSRRRIGYDFMLANIEEIKPSDLDLTIDGDEWSSISIENINENIINELDKVEQFVFYGATPNMYSIANPIDKRDLHYCKEVIKYIKINQYSLKYSGDICAYTKKNDINMHYLDPSNVKNIVDAVNNDAKAMVKAAEAEATEAKAANDEAAEAKADKAVEAAKAEAAKAANDAEAMVKAANDEAAEAKADKAVEAAEAEATEANNNFVSKYIPFLQTVIKKKINSVLVSTKIIENNDTLDTICKIIALLSYKEKSSKVAVKKNFWKSHYVDSDGNIFMNKLDPCTMTALDNLSELMSSLHIDKKKEETGGGAKKYKKKGPVNKGSSSNKKETKSKTQKTKKDIPKKEAKNAKPVKIKAPAKSPKQKK